MPSTKTPAERQRQAIRIWRTTRYRQSFRMMVQPDGARCATGVLLPDDFEPNPEGGGQAVWLVDYLAREYAIDSFGERVRCPADGCDVEDHPGATMLYHWNDDHRLTFEEIADLAERYPQAIFLPEGPP